MRRDSEIAIKMKTFRTIKKKSLSEEVADKIRRLIENGKLKKGEKLPVEPELSEMFGVGRSSIREATKLLASRGYLSIEQGRGTFVKDTLPEPESWRQVLQHSDIKDLRETRDLFDNAFAQLAARRCTEADLSEIKRWLDERGKTAKENNLQGCIEADVQFHLAIAKATHNHILIEIYKSIAEHQINSWQLLYEDTSRLCNSQQRHVQLFEDIKQGDTESVERSMKDLLGHIWENE